MMKTGPHNLITDVDGLAVGNAHDIKLKSGVTVLTGDKPFTAGVSIMGGAPGTREIALLDPDKLVTDIDAIVLSGGSAFGLEAAGGVMDGLKQDGRGFAVGTTHVPIVPAAILFDLLNNGDKDWQNNPYPGLGRKAYGQACQDDDGIFSLGTAGAGYGALAGDVKGGLGSASLILPNGITVGALVAVNAVGSPLTPDGKHFWAAPWEVDGEFGQLGQPSAYAPLTMPHLPKLTRHEDQIGGNTTIAIVATNAPLDKAGCQRMATAAHDGMARALVPAHTPYDGDLIFGVSTGTWEGEANVLDPVMIGHAASICLARAIARGVYEAASEDNDILPAFEAR